MLFLNVLNVLSTGIYFRSITSLAALLSASRTWQKGKEREKEKKGRMKILRCKTKCGVYSAVNAQGLSHTLHTDGGDLSSFFGGLLAYISRWV